MVTDSEFQKLLRRTSKLEAQMGNVKGRLGSVEEVLSIPPQPIPKIVDLEWRYCGGGTWSALSQKNDANYTVLVMADGTYSVKNGKKIFATLQEAKSICEDKEREIL